MQSFQTDGTIFETARKKTCKHTFCFFKNWSCHEDYTWCFWGEASWHPVKSPDVTGVFVELELSHEKWLSEELVPILDYRRNFFFPLNSSFLWIMALNVSGIFQFIFRWQVSWDGRGFMLGIILVKYKVGEGERRNACVCVLSSFFESICMTYEVCVVSLGN